MSVDILDEILDKYGIIGALIFAIAILCVIFGWLVVSIVYVWPVFIPIAASVYMIWSVKK